MNWFRFNETLIFTGNSTTCVILAALVLTVISPAAFGSPLAADDISELIKDLNNGEYRIRIGALRKITDSGGPSAEPTIPIIREILQRHGDPHMRAAAAQALQAIGPKGFPVLIETLNDQNTPGDNSAVIKAIGSFGPAAKEAVPTLIQIVEGGNVHLQQHAIKALGQIGVPAPAVFPSLKKMLESTNEFSPIFNELTIALSILVTPEALVPLLEDQQRIVRIAAASALGKMGVKAQVAVPALTARLKDREQPYRYAEALGGIGLPALPAIVQIIEDPSSPRMQRIYAVMVVGEIGPAAKDAVPLLNESLSDAELVHMAVEALGKMGSAASAAVPRLIELKNNSEHRYTRQQAAKALVQIGTPAALEATGLFRAKERLLDSMFAMMRGFLTFPGLVFIVPLFLYVLYALTKKYTLRTWAYRPLLLPTVLWGLYALYETFLQLFWASGEPIRVDLLVITPILFAALTIGLVPWGLNLLLPAVKQS